MKWPLTLVRMGDSLALGCRSRGVFRAGGRGSGCGTRPDGVSDLRWWIVGCRGVLA